MAVGYVLVNVTPGMEIAAYNSIKSMENVDDITVLFGDYDLIVKLVADDLASIAKTVVETIRPVQGVLNTKTLAGADVVESGFPWPVLLIFLTPKGVLRPICSAV